MELDYKAIGKRIKIARIKADLTQERLAERIGISPTHLSNIETGTTRVSLSTIISIANALSVTGDDLLCDNSRRSHPAGTNPALWILLRTRRHTPHGSFHKCRCWFPP